MTKEEVFSLIEKRKRELEIPYRKDSAYDYLKEFADNNKILTIEQFINMDIWSFLKCSYYIRSDRSYTIEEVNSMMNGFAPLFDCLSLSSLIALYEFLEDIVADDKVDEIVDFFHINGKRSMSKLLHISNNDSDTYRILEQLKKLNDNKKIDIIAFFNMLSVDSKLLLDIMDLYTIQANMKRDAEIIGGEVSNCGFNIRNREKSQILDSWFRENYFVNRILGEVNEVSSFVKREDREEAKQKRLRHDELCGLNTTISILERELQNPEIRNARYIVKHISDLEIKKAILQLIMEHNAVYYEELEKEYNYYNHNTKAHYKATLNDYDISYDDYSLGKIMHHSVDDIKNMLNVLIKMKIDKNNILAILENSNFSSIMKIKKYVDRGYLNISFLNKNIDIFYTDSEKLCVYENNLKLLKRYTINPLNFSACLYVLFEDSDLLESNLQLCMDYSLLKHFQTTRDYRFLEDDNLASKIDRLLELGYEEFLEKDLGCLNSNHLKRLEVIKALNIPIDSLEEFQTVLGDERDFFISDDVLDSYIPNVLPYVSGKVVMPIDKLSNYRNSLRTYSINGILVSIPKVSRLLNEGNDLYRAITFGMKLSEEEYRMLINSDSLIGTK